MSIRRVDCVLVYPIKYVFGVLHILLGEKTRDHCKGFLVGPGGRMNEGEYDPRISACRECEEETGIKARPGFLIELARLSIYKARDDKGNILKLRVFVYAVLEFSGDPEDSDELRNLQWISLSDIPEERLPPLDRHWFLIALALWKPLAVLEDSSVDPENPKITVQPFFKN